MKENKSNYLAYKKNKYDFIFDRSCYSQNNKRRNPNVRDVLPL